MASSKQLKALERARIRHGVYYFINHGLQPCELCPENECPYKKPERKCKIVKDLVNKTVQAVMNEPQVEERDLPVVEMFAKNRAILFMIERWLTRKGLTRKEDVTKATVRPQPIMQIYWVAQNAAMRQAEQLGLTPLARKQLGFDGKSNQNFARMMRDAIDG